MIYLDHAASSWPKPPEVVRAMSDFMNSGACPSRSGHQLSQAAQRSIANTREVLARLFHAADPNRVIFTLNATHAINLALRGMVHPGDRVVTSGIEHNAVTRPLHALAGQGICLAVVPVSSEGTFDLRAMADALREPTRLVVVTHASNVIGTILPIAAIADMAHAAGALFLVDAALTAGVLPIDVQAMGIDLLAFSGYKGLQGPPGVGGLVLGDGVDPAGIEPLIYGATTRCPETENQPELLPDKFESGMLNGASIAGLGAGVQTVLDRGVEAIWAHEMELTRVLLEVLGDLPGVTVYGPKKLAARGPLVSFTIARHSLVEVGLRLEKGFGVLCRAGLHDAPTAHRTIGTLPEGTIRFTPGPFTTIEEIDRALTAVEQIAMDSCS